MVTAVTDEWKPLKHGTYRDEVVDGFLVALLSNEVLYKRNHGDGRE